MCFGYALGERVNFLNVDPPALAELTDLTDKQIEVLELLVDHRSTKEIARILGISPSAVDQRIYAAADRLGEADRRQLARKYLSLKLTCDKLTGGFSQVQRDGEKDEFDFQESQSAGIFRFNDATDFHQFAPWIEDSRLPLLEKLDDRTGPLGRLAVIVATAALLALLLLAGLAIARTLGDVI